MRHISPCQYTIMCLYVDQTCTDASNRWQAVFRYIIKIVKLIGMRVKQCPLHVCQTWHRINCVHAVNWPKYFISIGMGSPVSLTVVLYYEVPHWHTSNPTSYHLCTLRHLVLKQIRSRRAVRINQGQGLPMVANTLTVFTVEVLKCYIIGTTLKI